MTATNIKWLLAYACAAYLGGYVGGKIADHFLERENREEAEIESAGTALVYEAPEETPDPERPLRVEEYAGRDLPEDSIIVNGYVLTALPEETEVPAPRRKRKTRPEPEEEEVDIEKIDYRKFRPANPHVQKARLSDLAAKYRQGEDEEETDPSKPHIISIDEYADPDSSNDRQILYYYEEDDTLCDLEENIIPDHESLLGEDALVKFGTRSDDPDIVHVRNNKNGTDYEVIRHHSSYKVVVLQIPEEEPKRRRKVTKKDAAS